MNVQYNLTTVCADVMRIILSFLNPRYEMILRIAIKNFVLSKSAPHERDTFAPHGRDKNNKWLDSFIKKREFYEFAEEYADHPDFRALFPTINFSHLYEYKCPKLHSRFVIIDANARQKKFASDFEDLTLDDFILRHTHGPRQHQPMNAACCKTCVQHITSYYVDLSKYLKLNSNLRHLICKDSRSHIYCYKYESIKDSATFARRCSYATSERCSYGALKQYDHTQYVFDEFKKLAAAGKVSQDNRNDFIHTFVVLNSIDHFIEFNKVIEFSKEDIIKAILARGSLEFLEWAEQNLEPQIFARAAAGTISKFKIIKACIERGINVVHHINRHYAWRKMKHIKFFHSLRPYGNIIELFFDMQYGIKLEDLKWAKDAGYSMARVFELSLYITGCGERLSKCGGGISPEGRKMVLWARANDPIICTDSKLHSSVDVVVPTRNDAESHSYEYWYDIAFRVCQTGHTWMLPEICEHIAFMPSNCIYIAREKPSFFREVVDYRLVDITKERRLNRYIDLRFCKPADLKWFILRGLELENKEDIDVLVEFCNFEMIKMLDELLYLDFDNLITLACEHGNLEALTWIAKRTHHRISPIQLREAELRGRMDMIKFAIERGSDYSISHLIKAIDMQINYSSESICSYLDADNYEIAKELYARESAKKY